MTWWSLFGVFATFALFALPWIGGQRIARAQIMGSPRPPVFPPLPEPLVPARVPEEDAVGQSDPDSPPSPWPPPTVWDDAALDRLLTAVRADPWGPPDVFTRVA